MSLELERTARDRSVYEEHLREWLPERLIDIHTHIWRRGEKWDPAEEGRATAWPSRVAAENPVEDLLATYRQLLPGTTVTPLVFASLPSRRTLARSNDYVAEAARRHRLPALLFTDPQWPAEELGRRLEAGGFVGAKVYLSFAPEAIPREDIRIFDFAPPHQLAELDRRRGILMLHLPRPGRLADAENLAQLEAIDERFPNLQTIVAHVGRAYCPEDVGDGLARLARTRHLRVDISANTNEWVFARLLEAVGPQRVLFGTDLPILRMRMRRVCEDGRYVNLVPPGRYGDLANDPHMREVGPAEAEELTLFLYEELLAFRRAAEAVGLSRRELEAVFHHNAAAVLERAGYTGAARPE